MSNTLVDYSLLWGTKRWSLSNLVLTYEYYWICIICAQRSIAPSDEIQREEIHWCQWSENNGKSYVPGGCGLHRNAQGSHTVGDWLIRNCATHLYLFRSMFFFIYHSSLVSIIKKKTTNAFVFTKAIPTVQLFLIYIMWNFFKLVSENLKLSFNDEHHYFLLCYITRLRKFCQCNRIDSRNGFAGRNWREHCVLERIRISGLTEIF